MEFSFRRRPKNVKIISEDLNELYPHDLQMYSVPPGNEINLSEFEDLALNRLKLLRTLEQASQKGHKLYSEAWQNTVLVDIRKQKLIDFLNLLSTPSDFSVQLQARRADHISHFILRLVYCRSEQLRRWFLTREQEWFKLRFIQATASSKSNEYINSFLKLNNLVYTPISDNEKEEIKSELYNCTAGVIDSSLSSNRFYKVPFVEVISLVKNRRVYMSKGFAYIPDTELITCILSLFRANLNQALAYASHKISFVDDDRLNNLLTSLHTSYTGRDYTVPENKDTVYIENIDQYSVKHFPMCMRHMHETFRTEHHMKNGVRQQYGLFIKGIGVTYDDCMRFWMEEFTKIIDQNKFDKNYSYTVKHHYGKVGRMVSYTPYSCMKIISSSVGTGEHHGCPFRHFDSIHLSQKLYEHGLNNKGIEEILDLVKNTHYQVACSKYFELRHGQASKNIISHPNEYFEESRALEGVKGTPSAKKPFSKHNETLGDEMEF